MPLKSAPIRLWPTLLLLALLVTGCASSSTPTSGPPALIPPLPAAARQPAMPSVCSPTCSAALTRERESWRQLLTLPEVLGSSASAPTTR